MTSRRLILPALAVLAAAAVAGCGSSSKKNTTSSPASTSATTAAAAPAATTAVGQTLKLSADPTGKLAFTPKTLTVSKPGTVTLVMTNPSSSGIPHGIAISGNGIDKDGKVVQPGGTSTVTVTLPKGGTYQFYCPFDSHKAQGMTGSLTVGGAKAASTKPAAKPSTSSSGSGGSSSGGSGSGGGSGY
jgi:plastocyanin